MTFMNDISSFLQPRTVVFATLLDASYMLCHNNEGVIGLTVIAY